MPLVTSTSFNANVFKQATEPDDWQEGDLWVDTDDGTVYVKQGGAAQEVSSVTADSTTTFTNKTVDGDGTGNAYTNMVTLSAEQSTSHLAKTTGDSSTNTRKYGDAFTVPSTYKFIEITALEVDWQGTTGQNVQCGVDIVDAEPPTEALVTTVALTPYVAQSGASQKQKISVLWSALIPTGAIIKPWVNSGDITNIGIVGSQASENQQKSITFDESPQLTDTTAWVATTSRMFVEIYYKGYS